VKLHPRWRTLLLAGAALIVGAILTMLAAWALFSWRSQDGDFLGFEVQPTQKERGRE